MPAEFIYSSIFGELTRRVQIRFDKISEYNKKVFDNILYETYLDWDLPSVGLNFEEIIGRYNITIAAPTIGDDSKEPIMGTEGLQTLAERIVRHAVTLPMSIQDYRKVLQILDSKSLSDATKAKQLTELMWGNVLAVVNAIHAKIDLIFLGALSNEGKFTLDADNNPEGGVRGIIDYRQPAENIATSKTAWTADNLDTVDCFEDIQAILDAAQDKVILDKILCAPSATSYMCRSKKIKQMIWGSDKSSRLVQLSDINAYMQENGFPTFEHIRRQIRIQSGTTTKPVTPWNAKNLVFVPAGKLGIIKNAYANNELRQEAGVTYSNYGRIRVSQWGAGETQGSNGVEFTKAEVFALPVITEMNGIYTLKTQQ
ncbi:MAG: major capsid protein [Prevotella sp.]|nr:major capsid protein [Lachnospiraceae bacterium]MCM1379567.1 major capsid protein [Bacteroides sp.]MCM1445831.1 major capsid protein [Prevotella sp.]